MSEGPKGRQTRAWAGTVPKMILATGYRDQVARITYIPWSDPLDGWIGWEVFPDRSTKAPPVLVYMAPTSKSGVFEIRCHVTYSDPDPENDELLGSITIPPAVLEP